EEVPIFYEPDAEEGESSLPDAQFPDIENRETAPEPTTEVDPELCLGRYIDAGDVARSDLLDELFSLTSEDVLSEPCVPLKYTRRGSILHGHIIPSTLMSGLCHVCLILILAVIPTYGRFSAGGKGDGGVMVKLVEQNTDQVPTDESPGSRDAPASLPMLAKRSPQATNKAAQPLAAPQQSFLDQSESGTKEAPGYDEERRDRRDSPTFLTNDSAHLPQDQKPQVKDARPDDALKDRKRVDSVHAYDSVPSLPSTASPPRVASGAPGTIGDEYRNKILSAISAAAFYPKRALAERIYGETIVTFTINKSGSIIQLSVKKPSGYSVLDDAAMTIVKKASKHFPSIPDELTTDSLSYDVPIIFKKRS
ncbi:MAG: energy transducer TonB, partial [Desulfomonilaceae bacterium]